LALLAELLGGVLAGTVVNDHDRPVNGLFLLLIDPTGFLAQGKAEQLATEVIDYMHRAQSAQGGGPVLVPGELEFQELARRSEAGGAWIDVDDGVWETLVDTAAEIGVRLGNVDGSPA